MGALGPEKGMGLGEMRRTEHAKENEAFRFVVVKDGWCKWGRVESERGGCQPKEGNWIDGVMEKLCP